MTTAIFFTTLYNSSYCRLCGNENSDGIYIYDPENDMELRTIINRYLPIKVDDDGKQPRTICPGCHIQVASTAQFFTLVAEGQSRLRRLWEQEVEIKKSLSRDKKLFSETLDQNPKISLTTGDYHKENEFLIKIFSDDQFFGPDHEMTLLVEGLEKPKRRRGRPKKQIQLDVIEEENSSATPKNQECSKDQGDSLDEADDGNLRHKRRRKPPLRLQEAVAGLELDRILFEEGAYDADENPISPLDDTVKEEVGKNSDNNLEEEIIGHVQTANGDKAEPILSYSKYRRRRLGRFICDFCRQTFKDRTRWLKHRAIHKSLRFQCGETSCRDTFTSLTRIRAHHAVSGHLGEDIVDTADISKNTEDGSLLCGTCCITVGSTQELATHMIEQHPIQKCEETNNTDSKLKCNLCPRAFNHPSSLIYHKETFHNNGIRFACSKCPKTFAHKQLLQRHQNVHSDCRPYTCNKCGVGFKSKANLLNHGVVHTGEKKFSCDICGQSFAHKTSLNLHIVWHQGLRPYKCPLCDKSFSQNGNLSEHLRIHNGEKPYICHHCGKAFTTSSQRKLHVKRHTGEKPWKCQYCGKQFLHKDTWKTHERRHTGEKPYICNYCQRAFAEHWSLKKHVRLHTGEKPYKCDSCGKVFADCSNLTKHKKVHAPSSLKVVSTLNSEGLSNENSLPVQISLPDGRDAFILSVENNMVHARTSDGWTIMLQLQHPPNVHDEETFNQIREAIASAQPSLEGQSEENTEEGGDDQQIDLEGWTLIQSN